jgi:hypothetical protein
MMGFPLSMTISYLPLFPVAQPVYEAMRFATSWSAWYKTQCTIRSSRWGGYTKVVAGYTMVDHYWRHWYLL